VWCQHMPQQIGHQKIIKEFEDRGLTRTSYTSCILGPRGALRCVTRRRRVSSHTSPLHSLPHDLLYITHTIVVFSHSFTIIVYIVRCLHICHGEYVGGSPQRVIAHLSPLVQLPCPQLALHQIVLFLPLLLPLAQLQQGTKKLFNI
jgi:hypothetical protein